MLLLYWIIGYICTLESGMFTVNGYTFSFNFTPLKTQYTKHTMGNFVGLMNATLSETITFVSVKFLFLDGFCLPLFFHGRVFVRPSFLMGGFLSAPYQNDVRVFVWKGFCPDTIFH